MRHSHLNTRDNNVRRNHSIQERIQQSVYVNLHCCARHEEYCPSFVKFEPGFPCLTSRASSFWRQKNLVSVSPPGVPQEKSIDKMKNRTEKTKYRKQVFGRASCGRGFCSFFLREKASQFLGAVCCPRVSQAQRATPATCVAGVYTPPSLERQSHIYMLLLCTCTGM